MLDRLFSLETFGIKLGLENITQLCAALGHPERTFASVHVAGTNGKGSVTAMVHTALVAAGVRSARYTSPHLVALAERFVVDAGPVTDAALTAAASDVMACIDRLRADGTLPVLPTFFEATTATAFELFRRAHVEVGVIEVGLGGRFDATNVLAPIAGAITTIGFDHQQHLGRTLREIAFEKAGIIKPGMPLVTGQLPDEAMDVIRAIGRERGAHVLEVSDSVAETTMIEGRAVMIVRTPDGTYGPVRLALRGAHQARNALIAVRLLELARQAGIPLDRAAIESGLAETVWPGRLELLGRPDGKRILFDAAHNPEGAAALAAYLQQWHPERPALVVGVMRDKDAEEILRPLRPCVSAIIATAAPTPRSMDAGRLAALAGPTALAVADPWQAIEQALQVADTVCVAGSIFLVGAVREALGRRAILL